MERISIYQLKILGQKQIVALRQNYEGDLVCQNLFEQDIHYWKLENPDLLEAPNV
jgi:hypothetical protein